jgi:hypothetical protein
MSTHDAVHPDPDTLAAYALGGLGPAEAETCERHLRDCGGPCRSQLAELAEIRAVLSLVHPSLVLDDPSLTGEPGTAQTAPGTAGSPAASASPGTAAGASPGAAAVPTAGRPAAPPPARLLSPRRRPPSRYERYVLPAAVAAAAVAVAVLALWRFAGGSTQSPRTATASTPADALVLAGLDGRITATMWLASGASGSRFSLHLHQAPADMTVRVVADLTDGSVRGAGQWKLPADDSRATLELDGSVAAPAAAITDFRVVDPAGETLVALRMPAR